MELTKSDINVTDLSGNYIHSSKSTDFIKPQDSMDNLESQQQNNGK